MYNKIAEYILRKLFFMFLDEYLLDSSLKGSLKFMKNFWNYLLLSILRKVKVSHAERFEKNIVESLNPLYILGKLHGEILDQKYARIHRYI